VRPFVSSAVLLRYTQRLVINKLQCFINTTVYNLIYHKLVNMVVISHNASMKTASEILQSHNFACCLFSTFINKNQP